MYFAASTRRGFLRRLTNAAIASTAVPYWLTARPTKAVPSKNDRPLVGCIGVGHRGTLVAQWAASCGDIVAVCDADRRNAEKARAALGGRADIYQDYRELLDRDDIEIIINATPDHWHTAINIAACKAGKDVYAEKPLTLTIEEGKRLCRVVEETERIVQVGTMQRSSKRFQTAVELVRNGRIGKLRQVWVALPYSTAKGGPFAPQPVPGSLDWDLYQGQAPLHDYCPQRTHRNFRRWFEYAGGIITDWGSHHMDIAHWGMDCELGGPISVAARGVFPNPSGPEYYNNPDRFFARLLYPSGVEVLFFAAPDKTLLDQDVPEEIRAIRHDVIFFIGERGRIHVNRKAVGGEAVDELQKNPLPPDAWLAYPSNDHMADFFDCVKTRKQPCATVQIEHRTATACHLTNISLRLKRKIAWDPQRQEIVGDDEAKAWQRRGQRAPYQIVA
jgi:predicted dehydrogenase